MKFEQQAVCRPVAARLKIRRIPKRKPVRRGPGLLSPCVMNNRECNIIIGVARSQRRVTYKTMYGNIVITVGHYRRGGPGDIQLDIDARLGTSPGLRRSGGVFPRRRRRRRPFRRTRRDPRITTPTALRQFIIIINNYCYDNAYGYVLIYARVRVIEYYYTIRRTDWIFALLSREIRFPPR